MIPENVAPVGAKRIGVYDENGKRCGIVPLGRMKPPDRSKRLYSFAVLSDPHIGKHTDADKAFAAAMKYAAEDDDIELVCITGDLVDDADNQTSWDTFKGFLSYDEQIPKLKGTSKKVFAVSGNHEWLKQYESAVNSATGVGTYAVQEHNADVFFLLGCYIYRGELINAEGNTIPNAQRFKIEDLEKIGTVFLDNRQKRVFAFLHVPPQKGHVDYDLSELSENTLAYLPLSLFQGTTVFHGHEHRRLEAQDNYRGDLGCRWIHVPPLCGQDGYPAGQGYIVDVYEDGIHLRGKNFRTKEDIPIGTYWIET